MNGKGDHRLDSRGLRRSTVMLVMGIVVQNWDNKQEMGREVLKRVNKRIWLIKDKYFLMYTKCLYTYMNEKDELCKTPKCNAYMNMMRWKLKSIVKWMNASPCGVWWRLVGWMSGSSHLDCSMSDKTCKYFFTKSRMAI